MSSLLEVPLEVVGNDNPRYMTASFELSKKTELGLPVRSEKMIHPSSQPRGVSILWPFLVRGILAHI